MSIAATLNRLRLAIARAVISRIDDSGSLQVVQVKIQAGVVRDQVERFQQYGMTAVPHESAEGVVLSMGGSTDHVVAINVEDRRYRMRGLATGEVALYDDLGQTVYLTRNGIVVRGAGLPMVFTDTPSITLDADVHVTKGLRLDGDADLNGDNVRHKDVNIGRQHKHGNVENGPDVSGNPV